MIGGGTPGAGRRGLARTLLPLLFAAAVLAPSIPGRELTPPDEPRFALVAREMYERHDPVVLHRAGETYTDKPPLLFWAAALLFGAAGGASPELARLPSLLASLLTVLLIGRAARAWVGERRALLAALIYPTLLLVLERGAWCSTDALLTAAVFGALTALDGEPRDRSAALWLSAGLLAKGPVAALFLLLAGLAARLAGYGRFRLRALARPRAFALLLLLTLPWPLALASRIGGERVLQALFHQNVGRFLHSWDNIEPWWYFGWALPAAVLPWSILLVPACAPRFARPLLAHRAVRWLAIWAGLATLFFSLPAGKRGVYLMPVMPALSVLCAAAFADLVRRRSGRIALGLTGAALAGAAGLAAALGAAGRLAPDAPGGLRAAGAIVLGLLAAGAALFAWLSARGRRAAVAGPLGFALAAGALFPPLITPALNETVGARRFAARATAVAAAGTEVGMTRSKWELAAWYTGWRVQRLDGPAAVGRYLAGPGRRVVAGVPEELGPASAWPAGTRRHLELTLGRDRLWILVRDDRERFRTDRDRDGRPVDNPRPPS